MSEIPDLETLYRLEKKRWLKEEAPRKAIRDWIAESVPYWIILVALVLFGLSAPHTASVFDKLTPGWGWIAPIGVEFGLLYTAFQRQLVKAQNKSFPWTLWALEILLFITAMLVNGAGSFTSVVAATQLDGLSFTAIKDDFGQLPATSQAALIMAGLSAFIIPIGALVAGEGLASLALEAHGMTDYREQRWQEAEFTVMYRAVFVFYLRQGLTEREARQRASAEVRGYLGRGNLSGVRTLSEVSGQRADEQSEQPSSTANGHKARVKEQVRAYLDAHPGLDQNSINRVMTTLKEAGVQAGRTTIGEVLQARKHDQENNADAAIERKG